MPIKRKSKTYRFLKIIEAACFDIASGIEEISLPYCELRKRLRSSGYRESDVSKTVHNLRRCGYLEIVESDNQKAIRLTRKGRFKSWKPYIKKSWDKRWRLVAFDIPEERRRARSDFRAALRRMGFRLMQKSLWICPYDVSEEIEEVMDILDLHEEVDYFIADAITNKDKYLAIFELNQ